MIDSRTIKKVVALLCKARPQATIILFGSRARGDADSASDIDLLVVEPRVKSRRREMVYLSDLLRPLRVPVDILVVSRKTFTEWSQTPGTIIHRAASEGKIVYAAA